MTKKVLCGCHNVTLEDVKNEIKKGVKTFEVLQAKTKIGTDCPPCKENNKQLFNDLLSELKK